MIGALLQNRYRLDAEIGREHGLDYDEHRLGQAAFALKHQPLGLRPAFVQLLDGLLAQIQAPIDREGDEPDLDPTQHVH